MEREIACRPIGTVKRTEGGISVLEVFPEFCEGLNRLTTFSHIFVLYWFHERDTENGRRVLRVRPKKHPGAPLVGVFASRSPDRPNPIGLSVVRLLGRDGCRLEVEGLDALEGTPVLDIKPYIPRADAISETRTPEYTLEGPPT